MIGLLRLGIIGSGTIVREVLPLLAGCGWRAAAICSTPRSEGLGEALCAQYSMENAFTDLGAMLSAIPLDAVYIGVPNHLHYAVAQQVLEAGIPAIVEKPLASNAQEARALAALAKKKDVPLIEAVSTLYHPNFDKIRQLLPEIGTVRLVSCNFSQYSRRYDAFRLGELPPVFDPDKSGGALMDLNSYHLHYLCGLFGEPAKLAYRANIERGIDTSGVLTLDYGTFQAIAVAAKDCSAPPICLIQGTEGYLLQTSTVNVCGAVTLHRNDGSEQVFSSVPPHRLVPEFHAFAEMLSSETNLGWREALAHSLRVSELLTQARLDVGIRFAADCEAV